MVRVLLFEFTTCFYLGVFTVHALLDPYFQILQIGSIIVSGLTSVFCGIFIVSAVYKISK